jgi:hypothetical protein
MRKTDTTPEAAAAHRQAIERLTPLERLRAVRRLSATARALRIAMLRAENPDLDADAIEELWFVEQYGEELAAASRAQRRAWRQKNSST